VEKFIFLATIKDKLTEMNLPKETVEKHVKIFEDCFSGKGASDVDKVINSAGGIDGILLSIYNLENAKRKDNNYICPVKEISIKEDPSKVDTQNSDSQTADVESAQAQNVENVTVQPEVVESTSSPRSDANEAPLANVTSEKTDITETDISPNEALSADKADEAVNEAPSAEADPKEDGLNQNNDNNQSEPSSQLDLNKIFNSADDTPDKSAVPEDNPPTIEITKTSEISEHIKEAEKITETLERIPIPSSKSEEEYPSELSDYDFEKLFEEKLSKPERWAKKLREKMSHKAFLWTLPLALIITAVAFLVVLLLFPILLATAIACAAAYVASLVIGLCFSIIPIGYGIYKCFNSMPVALYELGIGITSTGATMLASILLYNYVKRLVPFLFRQLIKLFKLCVKVTKRYFKKTVKEAE